MILFLLKKTNSNIFNPGPFWKLILLESFLIIFAPIILIIYPDAMNVYQMKGTSYSGVISNSVIFYSQFILLLFGLNLGISKHHFYHDKINIEKISQTSLFSVILALIILLILILNHVSTIPIFSFFFNENPAINRAIVGKELNGVYSILHTFTLTISWFIIYISAALKLAKKSWVLYLLIGIFGLSWFGHKSSIILALLGFYFYTIKNKSITFSSIFKVLTIIFFLLIILIIIYYNSIPDKSNLPSEFLNRLFIGQLHGFYQEFEYFESDVQYWKSWIPLSSFIFDEQISYAKDLMEYTEGITETNQLKNTFIGAETYHVLGLLGSLIIMPFVGYFISKLSFIIVNISSKFLGKFFSTPLLWTFLSSLTITNGIYTYSSFRFVYIFIASLIPVIVIKFIIDLIKDNCHG